MRFTDRQFVEGIHSSPGLLAGWVVLLLLACLPLTAFAQQQQKRSIVNIASGSGRLANGDTIHVIPDTATVDYATGSSGTTLIAYDTVTSVCRNADGSVTVSGYVDVTNGGDMPTRDLKIVVSVQYQAKNGKYTLITGTAQTTVPGAQLMPHTSGQYQYRITFKPIAAIYAYRTIASVTITDHSGHMDKPFGPTTTGTFNTRSLPLCTSSTGKPGNAWMAGAVAAPQMAVLDVRLEAARLEARSGEVVPLTATIANNAETEISAPVASFILPDGLGYVAGSIAGADSVKTNGNRVDVYLSGALPPGEFRAFKLQVAAIAAGRSKLDIRMSASAVGGNATSEIASVSVQTERNRASETRAVIGKVWADHNENNRQDQDEEGIAGVDVWTADGNIATTDSAGKFSFPELRLGTHALRIDPASVAPEYAIPSSSRYGVTVQVGGWNTPRVLLALVPRAAVVKKVRVAQDTRLVQIVARDVPPRQPSEVDVTVAARGATDEISFEIPPGWELVRFNGDPTGSGEKGGGSGTGGKTGSGDKGGGSDPRLVRGPAGSDWVISKVDPRTRIAILRLRALKNVETPAVRVNPIRVPVTPEEIKRRAIVTGPGVEIFSPADGTVFGKDRIYVGVHGEPGATVTLFDGTKEITHDVVRIDGQLDFISIKVPAGPHVLRVRMINSWNIQQWDSIHVHTSGTPAELIPEQDDVSAPADGKTITRVRVRVLDQWGVPVVNQPFITIKSELAQFATPDADRSSMGTQLRTDTLGWLTLAFTSARETGRGAIDLASRDATARINLDFFTAVRPLIVVGSAQLGFGATQRSEGAMTVRGHLDEKTSVTVSVDSRGRDPSNPRFGNQTDVLGEGVLPTIGDGAQLKSVGSYDSHLSARVEQGHQWLAYGDIQIGGSLDGLTLLRHNRSLRGLSGKLQIGGIEWSGFGAVSSQKFRQVQMRGDGTSGPYDLDGRMLMGTEQVHIEVRDPLNAQRVLTRQRLMAYVDYEVDYERGVLLLKQPLPAIDMNGNPLFLMISYEGQGAGTEKSVWGVRGQRNLFFRQAKGTAGADSVTAGLTYIRDDQVALGSLQLLGTDLHVAVGKSLQLNGEVVYVDRPDSSDVAWAVGGSFRPFGNALTFDGRWSTTGREFRNPADLSLVPGTSDIRVGASTQLRDTKLRLEHSAQDFGIQGGSRDRTMAMLTQPIAHNLELETSFSDDRYAGTQMSQRTGLANSKLSWSPGKRGRIWAEARQQLWSEGIGQMWGDHIGAGASLTLFKDLALEARHLRVSGDSVRYSLTEIGVRSSIAEGSRAWGSYQITGGVQGASNGAVLGMNNRFSIAKGWTLTTLFERRAGMQRAGANDPVRAAPFGQQSDDYWSGGVSVQLSPKSGAYHASAKTEMKRGNRENSQLFMLNGDVALNRSVAMLVRHDYSLRNWNGGMAVSQNRRIASNLGLAVRPARSETFNGLFQFRWLEDANPAVGGVLSHFGRERRLLASAEAIWSPSAGVEIGGRCATRLTRGSAIDSTQAIESRAVFCGGRYDLSLARNIVARGEARMLREEYGSLERWDIAPSLLLRTDRGIELGGGYRLGNLRDPDLASVSGRGWFFTLGLRATEAAVQNVADYWRMRFGHD